MRETISKSAQRTERKQHVHQWGTLERLSCDRCGDALYRETLPVGNGGMLTFTYRSERDGSALCRGKRVSA